MGAETSRRDRPPPCLSLLAVKSCIRVPQSRGACKVGKDGPERKLGETLIRPDPVTTQDSESQIPFDSRLVQVGALS